VPSLTPASEGGVLLTSLAATSARDVWAVGDYECCDGTLFLRTLTLHWDGSRWGQVPSPDLISPKDTPGNYGAFLRAVSASSPADAWAVGDADGGNRTVTMHWNGQRWTAVPSPSPGGPSALLDTLDGVAAVAPGSAYAVGGYSVLNLNSPQPDRGLLLRWDGNAWTQVASPNPGGAVNSLDGVASGPGGTVWAVGRWSGDLLSSNQALAAVFGTVPSVAGASRAVAVAALNGAGLVAAVTEVRPPDSGCGIGNAGTAVVQSPAAGTFTALPVNLTVCSTTTAVPGVLSFDDFSARRAITSAGLAVGTVSKAGSCIALRGEVLNQNPGQDTVVPVGSAVNLTESTGKQPNGKPCVIN
jgi:hypothetical protein